MEQKTSSRAGILASLPRRVPPEHRREFRESRLRTNVRRMYVFSLYIIVLQISLNIINLFKPSDSKSSDIMIYVYLSPGTLLLGVVSRDVSGTWNPSSSPTTGPTSSSSRGWPSAARC